MRALNWVTSSPSGSVRRPVASRTAAMAAAKASSSIGSPSTWIPLGPVGEVRGEVRPHAGASAPERGRGQTGGGRLSVGAHDVQGRSGALRVAEGREEGRHALEPEAHAEDLEPGDPHPGLLGAHGRLSRSMRRCARRAHPVRWRARDLVALGIHQVGGRAPTKAGLASLSSARASSVSALRARAPEAALRGRVDRSSAGPTAIERPSASRVVAETGRASAGARPRRCRGRSTAGCGGGSITSGQRAAAALGSSDRRAAP